MDGFAEIFAAHHAEALRVAFLLTGDRHLAEDVVAEAFLKVYRAWQRGGVRQPRAYLRRAVVNEVSSRFRRLAIERREAARQRGDDRGARSSEEDIADADVLAGALRRLPPRQRTAVVLRYYADLGEAETALAMGVSVGTVKSATSRGLASLRSLLAEPVTA